tara:strand:- start:1261 stop:1656 length:396 start_codon:yes stop_codon:yes gene_type:complete
MTAVFDDVTFEWAGNNYTIPARRLLGAIARVEGVVTIAELMQTQVARGTVKLAVLAQAFGEVLRYAGAKVTDDEVYVGLFASPANGGAGNAQGALAALVTLMVPPSVRSAAAADEEPATAQGKPTADATDS